MSVCAADEGGGAVVDHVHVRCRFTSSWRTDGAPWSSGRRTDSVMTSSSVVWSRNACGVTEGSQNMCRHQNESSKNWIETSHRGKMSEAYSDL